MANYVTAIDWKKLLPVLSLDRVLPLYAPMGVPGDDPAALQHEIRAVLSAKPASGESSWPGLLRDRLGAEQFALFADWAAGAYLGYHADQPEWSAWQIVFSQLAYSQRQRLDFLPLEKRQMFLSGYRDRAEIDDIKALDAGMAEAPLSAWDLEIYAAQEYGASWESGPFSVAEPLIAVERLKRFASAFLKAMEPTERDEFHRRGQTLIDELEVWMPGPLQRLDVLLRTA